MAVNGILLLDKPAGLSSNGALQRVRRLLRADKAGHVGSLDPLATGMLPICLGEATKIANDILSGRKRYRFTISLGARTSTGDTEGEVVETAPVPALSPGSIEGVLQRFLGRTMQVPPMYSALKRDGQPLYKLARAGIEVERAAREIQIFELPFLRFTAPADSAATVELECLCSKGTYIRTLSEDIAKALGTCGHVAVLRRVSVEPFMEEPMETLESVTQAAAEGRMPRLLPPDWPLAHLPAAALNRFETERVLHGQAVAAQVTYPAGQSPPAAPSGRIRLYDAAGRFIGLGEPDGHGNIQPRRLFVL